MNDVHSHLQKIRRPRLLVSAARFGLKDYDRTAIMSRLFGAAIPRPGRGCLEDLIEMEIALDAMRRRGDTTYSITRHVEVLVALMAESRALAQTA